MLPFETESGNQTIFLNPFTCFAECKSKFVVCPFVYKETNGSYPYANGLNRTKLTEQTKPTKRTKPIKPTCPLW